MNLKPLSDQVIVILGASSGIGRQAAIDAAARGARVVAAARSERGLSSLADAVRDSGGEITTVTCDVTDYAQVERVAETAVETYGRIDTWVNVAGVGGFSSFEETSLEEFRQIIDINLMGYVHGAKAALPRLRAAGGGALISIGSVESQVTLPLHSHYAATKHAIAGLMDGIRRELQAAGVPISVTTIKPGSINTPFFSNAMTKLGVKPMAPPPVYEADVVSECILYAAEHPVRDLYAGGAAKMMAATQVLMPSVMDRIMARAAIPGQRSDEMATGDITGNLFASSHDDRVEGDFSDKASALSPYTWLETHPSAKMIALGAAAGIGMLLTRKR